MSTATPPLWSDTTFHEILFQYQTLCKLSDSGARLGLAVRKDKFMHEICLIQSGRVTV